MAASSAFSLIRDIPISRMYVGTNCSTNAVDALNAIVDCGLSVLFRRTPYLLMS